MVTEEHREILKDIFGSGPIKKVQRYLEKNNIVHPNTGRVPSYSLVRYVYNGCRGDGTPAEDKFIEEKIFEYAEIYKKEKIKQQEASDMRAKMLKNLK